jgi:hypothetical protein
MLFSIGFFKKTEPLTLCAVVFVKQCDADAIVDEYDESNTSNATPPSNSRAM